MDLIYDWSHKVKCLEQGLRGGIPYEYTFLYIDKITFIPMMTYL